MLTAWDDFKSSPLRFLAQRVYSWARPHSLAPMENPVTIVCLSDTHNSQHEQPDLPDGDILIHGGDLTKEGQEDEFRDALDWLSRQRYQHKIFVAGNHDASLADHTTRDQIISGYPSLTYLENKSTKVTVRGRDLLIHGSPNTPKFGKWSFQYPYVTPSTYSPDTKPDTDSECEATKIWSFIPPHTDVLVTHGPPLSHLDFYAKKQVGCYALLCALWRVRPRLHVFGHVHSERGVEYLSWDGAQKAYEDVCAGRAGWGGLARLVFWTAVVKVRRIWRWDQEGETIIVNAAAIGGVGDREQLGATVVEI